MALALSKEILNYLVHQEPLGIFDDRVGTRYLFEFPGGIGNLIEVRDEKDLQGNRRTEYYCYWYPLHTGLPDDYEEYLVQKTPEGIEQMLSEAYTRYISNQAPNQAAMTKTDIELIKEILDLEDAIRDRRPDAFEIRTVENEMAGTVLFRIENNSNGWLMEFSGWGELKEVLERGLNWIEKCQQNPFLTRTGS